MTDTAVLMLAMPFVMLTIFCVAVAVLGLTLAFAATLLGPICSVTQKFAQAWGERKAFKKRKLESESWD